MRTSRSYRVWIFWVASVVVLVAAFGYLRLRHRLPPGMLKDVKAGMAARHIEDPDQRVLRYLDARYGSMSDPAHRQEAFVSFFDIEHIRALHLLVQHSPQSHRQGNVDAMARWIAGYRANLTAEERAALLARFQSADGQALLKRATAQYNSQDVQYRSSTAGVISELLKTLREIDPHK